MASKNTAVVEARKTKADRRSASAGSQSLKSRWPQLHRGDREIFPDTSRVAHQIGQNPLLAEFASAHGGAARVAATLQAAWSAFHTGKFSEAIVLGSSAGALGASVANKSAAIHSLYARAEEAKLIRLLEDAAERGESALRVLSREANVHYTLALVLGRYSQRISILRALAQGMAERVRGHLDRTLELEPYHAEAHVALGLFHAELIGKLGSVAASLTYRASASAAIQHFERAIELTPDSPIALMEYAHGLLLINAAGHRDQAVTLYQRAAGCRPADAMERLDQARARREFAAL